jgi:hypothetical protein
MLASPSGLSELGQRIMLHSEQQQHIYTFLNHLHEKLENS